MSIAQICHIFEKSSKQREAAVKDNRVCETDALQIYIIVYIIEVGSK